MPSEPLLLFFPVYFGTVIAFYNNNNISEKYTLYDSKPGHLSANGMPSHKLIKRGIYFMSTAYVLSVFAIVIVLMIVLISKCKV